MITNGRKKRVHIRRFHGFIIMRVDVAISLLNVFAYSSTSPPSPLLSRTMPRPLKYHALVEFSYSYLINRHGNNIINKVKLIIDRIKAY